jgi:Ergosterol biosynthesis ERG4/ERG24 family
MDIAHDRAGFYLCWGCLNWVPGVYTSQVLYMTRHPRSFSQPAGIALLLVGTAMIYINWEADAQRQKFRETNGRCTIWSQPPRYIRAKYTTGVMSSCSTPWPRCWGRLLQGCCARAASHDCSWHGRPQMTSPSDLSKPEIVHFPCTALQPHSAVSHILCVRRCQRSHYSLGNIL